mgnify:CR=1 FL=1
MCSLDECDARTWGNSFLTLAVGAVLIFIGAANLPITRADNQTPPTAQAPTKQSECGLIHKIGKDQSWVRYDWTYSNHRTGREPVELAGQLTITLAGNEMYENKKCRWVEFKIVVPEGERAHTAVVKLLVPEDKLRDGPLSHSLKQSFKLDDRPPLTTEELRQGTPAWLRQAFNVLERSFGPLTGDAATLRNVVEQKRVDYQQGQLKCKGLQSSATVKGLDSQGQPSGMEAETTRTIWLNDAVPFDVAACDIERKLLRAGKLHRKEMFFFSLSDFGRQPKTALRETK